MTGIAMAAAGAAGGGWNINVTIGAATLNTNGYGGSYGSVSRSTVKSATLSFIDSSSAADFELGLSTGGLPRSYFNHLIVRDSSGAWRRYTTASAGGFSNSGGFTIWNWGGGTNRAWSTSSEGTTREVIFFF